MAVDCTRAVFSVVLRFAAISLIPRPFSSRKATSFSAADSCHFVSCCQHIDADHDNDAAQRESHHRALFEVHGSELAIIMMIASCSGRGGSVSGVLLAFLLRQLQ